MEQFLVGIKNFLEYINQNWTLITIIIGLSILLWRRVKKYLALSEQEKVDLALNQIRIAMLDMVSKAEMTYDEWVKAGAIKRSEVISKIYAQYPVLGKVIDQDALIEQIDALIDEALDEMREVIERKETENDK